MGNDTTLALLCRDGDDRWIQGGKHVGRFHGDEVFDSSGRYLVEMRHDWRLIVRSAKSGPTPSGPNGEP